MNKWFGPNRKKAAFPLALAATLSACSTTQPVQNLQSWGYASWWVEPDMNGILSSKFDRLAFFEIEISPNGDIANAHGWPDGHRTLRNIANTGSIPLDLTMTLKGKENFETLFSSDEAVSRLTANCLTLLRDRGVAGLQLDIELYDPTTDRSVAAFRKFVTNLASMMKLQNKILSVFVPMGGPMIYDRSSLRNVDWVLMQSYDAHWSDSAQAGPVAPLRGPEAVTWSHALETANSLGVPSHRVLMTFPLYGYEWRVTNASVRGESAGTAGITSLVPVDGLDPKYIIGDVRSRTTKHGCKLDNPTGSMHYSYEAADGMHVGWYEGLWSMRRKRDFVRKNGVAGMAFFVIGYDGYELTKAYRAGLVPQAIKKPGACT